MRALAGPPTSPGLCLWRCALTFNLSQEKMKQWAARFPPTLHLFLSRLLRSLEQWISWYNADPRAHHQLESIVHILSHLLSVFLSVVIDTIFLNRVRVSRRLPDVSALNTAACES